MKRRTGCRTPSVPSLHPTGRCRRWLRLRTSRPATWRACSWRTWAHRHAPMWLACGWRAAGTGRACPAGGPRAQTSAGRSGGERRPPMAADACFADRAAGWTCGWPPANRNKRTSGNLTSRAGFRIGTPRPGARQLLAMTSCLPKGICFVTLCLWAHTEVPVPPNLAWHLLNSSVPPHFNHRKVNPT